jgi:hypothetical protein
MTGCVFNFAECFFAQFKILKNVNAQTILMSIFVSPISVKLKGAQTHKIFRVRTKMRIE